MSLCAYFFPNLLHFTSLLWLVFFLQNFKFIQLQVVAISGIYVGHCCWNDVAILQMFEMRKTPAIICTSDIIEAIWVETPTREVKKTHSKWHSAMKNKCLNQTGRLLTTTLAALYTIITSLVRSFVRSFGACIILCAVCCVCVLHRSHKVCMKWRDRNHKARKSELLLLLLRPNIVQRMAMHSIIAMQARQFFRQARSMKKIPSCY